MTDLRIIVDVAHGHWSAWFEASPHETFQGETPQTAVETLWESELNSRKATRDRKTIVDSASRDRWKSGGD